MPKNKLKESKFRYTPIKQFLESQGSRLNGYSNTESFDEPINTYD